MELLCTQTHWQSSSWPLKNEVSKCCLWLCNSIMSLSPSVGCLWCFQEFKTKIFFVLCVLTEPIMKSIMKTECLGNYFFPLLVYCYWFFKNQNKAWKCLFGWIVRFCEYLQSSKAQKIWQMTDNKGSQTERIRTKKVWSFNQKT